jgi:hypothetical protein
MDDPVATCFRIAEIEHDGIVARGANKAPIRSWPKIELAQVCAFLPPFERTKGAKLRYRLLTTPEHDSLGLSYGGLASR